MPKQIWMVSILILTFACKSSKTETNENEFKNQLTLAFGSCNKTELKNELWDDVRKANPDIWIWAGDNIYADTGDAQILKRMYIQQSRIPEYARMARQIPVVGTWDDHDYGINDGGVEFPEKQQSQHAFLDFLGVSEDSPRRNQQGIYASHVLSTPYGSLRIIVLDTRYFRTALTPDELTEKRYKPNMSNEGTILGEEQWKWLAKELSESTSDFNLLVSSIQILSNQHGFECWGNFPHEIERLKTLLKESGAKGVILVSGDRHISEFSKLKVEGLSYPVIDFTSSGLTHTYEDFTEEYNPYRIGEVIVDKSFGLIQINFEKKEAQFQMVGDGGRIFQELRQKY